MFRKPKYFLAAFGLAHWAKHPVYGGVYGHDPNFVASSGIAPGDVVLLYCSGSVPEDQYQNKIPGIGVVTTINTERGFNYQYLPLCHSIPVDWDIMKKNIPEYEPPGRRNFSLKGNFLRQIASSSFRAAIAGRQIDWP